MPKQSNIVSFEEARASARNRAAAKTRSIAKTRTLSSSDQTYEANELSAESALPSSRSRREDAKRRRMKARASRKFDAAYGATDAPQTDAGPRAAVYQAKMGRRHRAAASALQQKAAGFTSAASAFVAGLRLPDFKRLPKKTMRALFAVFCAGFLCFMLYTPAQQCYQQMRERDRLEAEYASVLERNDALAASVDRLQSDAGIEDKAHSEYGMVKEGEQAGSVSGIDVENSTDFAANVVPGGVPAPDTWYSGVLDILFGYSK